MIKDQSEPGDLQRRRKRADAVRNEDTLLQAAKEVFEKQGVAAPSRAIAAAAGVGVGTLYRRFPQRSDLIAAVFRREVDACVAEATTLAAQRSPGDAVVAWLRRYVAFMATKKGLASVLHSGDPAYEALPTYFRTNFEPALQMLLESAVMAGEVRQGVEPYDLLRLIGNLAMAEGNDAPAYRGRMLDLLLDGLRSGTVVAAETASIGPSGSG